MKQASARPLISLPIATNDGIFMAHYSDQGLVELNFPTGRAGNPLRAVDGRPLSSIGNPKSAIRNVRSWHRLTETALKKVLAGHAATQLPPLDWTGATPFQQSVWRELLKIGCGETRSYGQIAKAIRNPAAVRAVGGACGANPIPILVPCHRVLAAHGRLGGFSGGLDRKRSLLAREGIVL